MNLIHFEVKTEVKAATVCAPVFTGHIMQWVEGEGSAF
jgi:hypothetical protein